MIEEIRKEALKEGVPIIKDEGLAFLLNFIVQHDLKQILELGTAVAYSAIAMAKISGDIQIDTIEKRPEMYNQAVINIQKEGLEKQIRAHFLAIEDFVPDRCYDLVFVDAAKAQYGAYLERFLPYLKDDGYMLFDNMVFHGLVYEIDGIKSRSLRSLVRKIRNFSEKVHNDDRFDIMDFDQIGDGILVLSRRKSGF